MKYKCALLFFLPLISHAADFVDFADLPPRAAVTQALTLHPAVKAAEAGVSVAEANKDRLVAGPHEFTLRMEGQRRRDVPLDVKYDEQTVGIERSVRLPGKGAIDTALGKAGISQAEYAFGDALHETARRLLKQWFNWQRERATTQEWQAQVDILRHQYDVAKKRVAVGDAARLEVLQAEAQLNQAQAQHAQAEAMTKLAATDFTQQFPNIMLPAAPQLAQPQSPPANAEPWLEKMLMRNHELLTAAAASHHQQLIAQRTDAERLPDPMLGLRVSRERDGQEKLLGLQLVIPLPGAARAASSRAELAGVNVAAAREAQVKAKVEAESRRTLIEARAAFGQWERLVSVAARMAENAQLLDKAWRLGEGQFADLQFARRQAIEARLAAVRAQLDANETRYRILLDAHELWALDTHEDAAGSAQDSALP
ncbi:TolC family protein [Rugosibacter aromaticivorans]|uniref:TolC family protein n=1 Tax=Rugosibacter aromaticivorans TaxID=1565605 RepID=UPI001208B762|nr:TolC family protein [Rugosibacter aromaticivorans]TBR14226.1 MAG: TolC family protein [Rugosibacter sp.]